MACNRLESYEAAFEDEELLFLKPVDQRFVCEICSNLMKDPSLLVCCGKKICGVCFSKCTVAKHSQICPYCRSPTRCVVDKEMKREIESLHICCFNQSETCKWTVELRQLDAYRKHVETCDALVSARVPVPVANNRCSIGKGKHVELCTTTLKHLYYGEYSYDFVEHVHNRFICTICITVLKDPQLLTCCGHKCCSACLQRWSQQSPSCPCCQEPVAYVSERGLKSELESLKVMCPYQYRGCAWTGELREVMTHLEHGGCSHSGNTCTHCKTNFTIVSLPEHEKVCLLAPIDCPNGCGVVGILRRELKVHRKNCKFELIRCKNGCSKMIKRQDVMDHMKNVCELRQKQCAYCKTTCIAKKYSTHEKECSMFPLECPNNCGKKRILRRDLSSHRQECRMESVPCQHWSRGCQEKVKRQEMKNHLKNRCRFRLVKCKHCETETTVKDHSNHTQVCVEFPVNCPSGCKTSGMVRKDLQNHKQTCTHELVPCGHVSGGCSKNVARQNMKRHLRNECELTKTQCPYCNTSYTCGTYLDHEELCGLVPKVCPNKCGQKGLVGSTLRSHREKCHLEMILCKDCNAKLRRGRIQNHLINQCSFRQITCRYCNASLAFRDYSTHKGFCKDYPLDCRYCRMKGIKRQDMENHLANRCKGNKYKHPAVRNRRTNSQYLEHQNKYAVNTLCRSMVVYHGNLKYVMVAACSCPECGKIAAALFVREDILEESTGGNESEDYSEIRYEDDESSRNLFIVVLLILIFVVILKWIF